MVNSGTLTNPNFHLHIQVNQTSVVQFKTYTDLKVYMQNISLDESKLLNDTILYKLIHGYRLVENFIDSPETFVYFRPLAAGDDIRFALHAPNGRLLYPTRFDLCECLNLLKCPQGTHSLNLGAKLLSDCIPTEDDVLSRFFLEPTQNEKSDFSVHNFDQTRVEIHNPRALSLEAYDIAIISMNLQVLPRNMTYGRDYRLSIFKNCKPCPTRYKCIGETGCSYPPKKDQYSMLNDCLKTFRTDVCVHKNTTLIPLETCKGRNGQNDTMLYSQPNLEKCLASSSFLCEERNWDELKFRRVCKNDYDGSLFPCSDIQLWNDYLKIRDLSCCSYKKNLNSAKTCSRESCLMGALEEQSFLDNLDPIFQRVKKYLLLGYGPRGSFVMDKDLQEATDTDDILSLFEYSYYFSDGNFRTNVPWVRSKNCCKCKSEPLPSFFRSNKETSGFPDNKHRNITFTISSSEKSNITVAIDLLNGHYQSFFAILSQRNDTFSFVIHRPTQFSNLKQGSQWLSIVKRETQAYSYIDYPLNLPHRKVGQNVDTLLIDRPCKPLISLQTGDHDNEYEAYDDDGKQHPEDTCIPDDYSFVQKTDAWWTNGSQTISAVALPYFPYFSNCDEFDSHVSLSRIIEEHPDCTKVPHNQTTYVKQFVLPDTKFPQGDYCLHHYPPLSNHDIIKGGAALHCHFEEQIEMPSDQNRWYEVEAGGILFYMTKDAIASSNFQLEYQSSEEHSATLAIEEDHIIPVIVSELHEGMKNTIPREVTLELQYFQLDKYNKRLVSATMYFSKHCTILKPEHFGGDPEKLKEMKALNVTPCQVDINGKMKTLEYTLHIALYPLEWFNLLNKFQLHGLVYLMYFMFAGFVSACVSYVLWGLNRITTKLRYPPKFHGLSLFKLLVEPSLYGTTMSLSILISCCFLSLAIIHSRPSFWDQIIGDWYVTFIPDEEMLLTIENGRVGMILLIVGVYLTSLSTSHIILQKECPKNNNDSGEDYFADIFQDNDVMCNGAKFHKMISWKRVHFLLFCFTIELCLLCLWELSYSHYFEAFLYEIVVISKIVLWMLEIISKRVLDDKLLSVPLLVSLEVSLIILTMGASNFIDFTGVVFAQMSMTALHRTYVYPFMKSLESLWPRWRFVLTQKLNPTLKMKAQERLLQARKWKQINEIIELRNEGSEPILDAITLFSINIMSRLLSPLPFILISSHYYQSHMAANYNVGPKELAYYALFACCMIPWSFAIDVIIFNTQEVVHGWKLCEYLDFQRQIFVSRSCKWSLHNPDTSDNKTSVAKHLRNIDRMNFSSQYYFATSLLAGSIIVTLFGGTILMRTEEYTFLSDPALPILFISVLSVVTVLKYFAVFMFSKKIGYLDWEGIWGNFDGGGAGQGSTDGALASPSNKDSVTNYFGTEDAEQEADDLEQAMHDEVFRQRFLDRNRPWLLRKIINTILSEKGKNKFSYMEKMKILQYTKDVYSELTTIQNLNPEKEGRIPDASSCSDAADDLLRRSSWNFEAADISTDVMKLWVAKARKRKLYWNAVSELVAKNASSVCSICSRTSKSSNDRLDVYLCRNGMNDSFALDSLIDQFEHDFSPITTLSNRDDEELWKSFFWKNAEMKTICNLCVTHSITKGTIEKYVLRPPPPRRPVTSGTNKTPGVDISSDEEEELEQESSTSRFLFEPSKIDQHSVPGRILSKWLLTARNGKVRGDISSHSHQRQGEKMMGKGSKSGVHIASISDVGGNGLLVRKNVQFSTREYPELKITTTMMLSKWLDAARDNRRSYVLNRGKNVRIELNNFLEMIDTAHQQDEFLQQGLKLQFAADSLTKDLEMATMRETALIKEIEAEKSAYIHEIEAERDRKMEEHNSKLKELRSAYDKRLAIRTRELKIASEQTSSSKEDIERFKASMESEQIQISKELQVIEQDAQNKLYEIFDSMKRDMRQKENEARNHIHQIRMQQVGRVQEEEHKWQQDTLKWLYIAKRNKKR
jgi:Chromosome segregation ATPases